MVNAAAAIPIVRTPKYRPPLALHRAAGLALGEVRHDGDVEYQITFGRIAADKRDAENVVPARKNFRKTASAILRPNRAIPH